MAYIILTHIPLMNIYMYILKIISRCVTSGEHAEEYKLPYQFLVADEPTLEEIISIVCDEKLRPTIPERFYTHEILKAMVKLIQVSVLNFFIISLDKSSPKS